MENFNCKILHNRIDCTWEHNGVFRNRSFTLSEIKSLDDITDNACILFSEDSNGDLVSPVNLTKKRYEERSFAPITSDIGTAPTKIALFIPFRDMESFSGVCVFQPEDGIVYFFKHWYQPIVFIDPIIPFGSKEKTAYVRVMLNDAFTTNTCHMWAVLQNVNTSKDCSFLLSKTMLDMSGETSLSIDCSEMKKNDVYALRVFSEYSRFFSSPTCCSTILRVRSDI